MDVVHRALMAQHVRRRGEVFANAAKCLNHPQHIKYKSLRLLYLPHASRRPTHCRHLMMWESLQVVSYGPPGGGLMLPEGDKRLKGEPKDGVTHQATRPWCRTCGSVRSCLRCNMGVCVCMCVQVR
jgi:hypothetical protein